MTAPEYTRKHSAGRNAGTIKSSLKSVKIRRLAFSSSHGPSALSTATTLPSARRSLCAGSRSRAEAAAHVMMTINEMYTALGTPALVALFLLMITGILEITGDKGQQDVAH